MPFLDRFEAGRLLGKRLRSYARRADVIVLALPRGGVPVGYEVSRALSLPLDLFLVRKLGVPGHEELAMGALASGGLVVLNVDLVRGLGLEDEMIEAIVQREHEELTRRERLYRGDRPPLEVAGKTVVVVDDGLATGASMRAAVLALKRMGPARIVVAVPVAAAEICADIGREVDEIVCVETPDPFYAVGLWYDDFAQTTDEQVRALLERSVRERGRLVA